MSEELDLSGVLANVVQSDPNGVLNEETVFEFSQEGQFVTALFSGGRVKSGFLVGTLDEWVLSFRYVRAQHDGD